MGFHYNYNVIFTYINIYNDNSKNILNKKKYISILINIYIYPVHWIESLHSQNTVVWTCHLRIDEVAPAVREMRNGKAPGSDGIPAEIYKHGGDALLHRLHALFKIAWQDEEVPSSRVQLLSPSTRRRETARITGTIVASRYYPLLGKF